MQTFQPTSNDAPPFMVLSDHQESIFTVPSYASVFFTYHFPSVNNHLLSPCCISSTELRLTHMLNYFTGCARWFYEVHMLPLSWVGKWWHRLGKLSGPGGRPGGLVLHHSTTPGFLSPPPICTPLPPQGFCPYPHQSQSGSHALWVRKVLLWSRDALPL